MNVLRAISAGPGLPLDRFDGRVYSAFASAANLLLADGCLVTLLASGHANQPRAARLDTPPGFRFEDHLHAGQPAACRTGLLRFSNVLLQIDLRRASHWDARLKPGDHRQGPPGRPALALALDELRRHPAAPDGIAGAVFDLGAAVTPLVRAAREPAQALISAASCLDLPAAMAAAAPLIGLGPGLTPSGDDFLVGFLNGLWAAGSSLAGRAAFVDSLGGEIASLTARTNDISRGFLFDAAQGLASESIIRLVEALHTSDEMAIRSAARAALDLGSTSGADTVAGLLSALGAVDGSVSALLEAEG